MRPTFAASVICFYIATSQATADYSMIEVYGKPVSFNWTNTRNFTWKECVEFCYEKPECALAYNENENKCSWFALNNISTVEKTTKLEGFATAKIYFWAQGFGMQYNYTIVFANNIWKFTFTLKYACPITTSYVFVQRPGGVEWCFVTPIAPNGTPYTEAANACPSMENNVFTGPATIAEFELLAATMKKRLAQTGNRDYLLRVHGKRTTAENPKHRGL